MFDTHCHLQSYKTDVAGVIERSRQRGVVQMLCCGTRVGDWSAVEALASEYDDVIPAFGIHPWYVAEAAECNWQDSLREYLSRNPKAVVGEVGLDCAVRPRADDLQMEIFLGQLRLADEFERPVSVHCVRAWGPLLEALKRVGGVRHGIVLHSFSGSREIVRDLLPYGILFSFSGAITNPSYERAAALVKSIPEDRLLMETDAPDMIPYSLKNETTVNEPANLSIVANKIAEFRGVNVSDIIKITTENALRIFKNIK